MAGNVVADTRWQMLLFFALICSIQTSSSQNLTCKVPSELVFVLDGSESLSETDFLNMKNFVISLLTKLEINRQHTRVGVIVFGTFPGDVIDLGEVNYVQVLNLRIVGLKQPKSGATGTARALERMREMFANKSRPGAEKLGIVITDGLSVSPKNTIRQATRAKLDGIKMISIGFGSNVFRNELIQIAGSPDNVFVSNDFKHLVQTVESAVKNLVCEVLTTTSQASTTQVSTTPVPSTHAQTSRTLTSAIGVATTVAPNVPPRSPTHQPTVLPGTNFFPVTNKIISNPDFCPNCIIGRDWGLKSFPGDCTRYVSMFPDDHGGRVDSLQQCPFGTYWQLSTLSCQFSFLVDCIYDPCHGVTSGAVPMQDMCSGYWSCIHGHAFASCCTKPNQRFIPGHGCVDDPTCYSQCPPAESGHLFSPMICTRHIDPLDPTKYYEEIPGYGNMSRSCATGTMFMAGDCECSRLIDDLSFLPSQGCKEDVYLTFDDSFRDVSSNDIALGHENVILESQAAVFTGNGMINLWRFSNTDFLKSLVIKFKFQPSINSNGEPIQALVTNCIFSDKQESSLAISIMPFNQTISFRTITDEGMQEVMATYDETIMNDVVFIYDGVKITAIVNNRVEQASLTGDIARRQSGIVLGAGSKLGHYFGKIDDVKIYLCFPDDVIPWL